LTVVENKNRNRISVIEFPSGNKWEWNQPERKRKMNHRGERGRHWKIILKLSLKNKIKLKEEECFSLEGSVTPYLTFGRLVSMCVHIFFIFIFLFLWVPLYTCACVSIYLLFPALVGAFPPFLSLSFVEDLDHISLDGKSRDHRQCGSYSG
jgi:hypothetical protein